ncbi:hypothetical protein RGQ13_19175 [Thalassotalea psychrophila]|uniref:Uncharacterized protein n=1 Tax=Thalassotalea psychrophila TaxID=3065647 RepID=A0ABY9TU07_9GAMM|nr:hypothetical protein RGQ13_19175 [Colwelliaceae bacterium SQ149]
MTNDDAQKLSILMLQINALMDQSTAFVQDKYSEEEFHKYRLQAGEVMGPVCNILNNIYSGHPDLKPTQIGGTYSIPDDIFKNKFYERK